MNDYTNSLSTVLERLSTGCRINSAKDDAAGCAISASLSRRVSATEIVSKNIQTAQSLVSTADDGYNNLTDILSRIRTLALSALNDSNSPIEIQALQNEAQNQMYEFYRTKSATEFGGKKILGDEDIDDYLTQKAKEKAKDEEKEKTNAAQKAREADLITQGYTPVFTAQELKNALKVNDANCKVVLCADINLDELGLDETGSNWIAVGNQNSNNYFKGKFDGNGHTISNLKINKSNSDYQGFFGYTEGAEIKNVTMINVEVKGRSETGGLVGYTYYSTVQDCALSGNVSGNAHTGGVVGYNHYSTVGNCTSLGNIVGGSGRRIGGIVGFNLYSTVENCTSSVNITGGADGRNGGIVGQNSYDSTIRNCSSSGTVTGGKNTGGLVGYHNSASIENCSTVSIVTRLNGTSNIGAFVGDYVSGTMSNNEYNPNINPDLRPSGNKNVTLNEIIANPNLNIEIPTIEEENMEEEIEEEEIEYNKKYRGVEMSVQVGIDSEASSTIEIDTGIEIGYIKIDFSTEEEIKETIKNIDEAMNKITDKRGEIGAVANRLNSILDLQNTSLISLNQSNSIIKDADYAQETSNFIKTQILQQVTTSLLSVANQTPSLALALITA